MSVHWLDHVFLAVLLLAFPLTDFRALRRKRDAIRAGNTHLREALFRSIVWQEWAMVGVLFAIWLKLGRDFGDLVAVPTTTARFWLGTVLAVAGSVLLIAQALYVPKSPKLLAQVSRQIEPYRFMVAHTARERRWWSVVSVTAGICEELALRGYIFLYLAALTGWSVWPIIGVSAALFGWIHVYQGWSGVLRTGLIGLAFGLVYALTGSLIAPIVLHAVVDLTTGKITSAAVARKVCDP